MSVISVRTRGLSSGLVSRLSTWWPRSRRCWTTWRPALPLPPVNMMRLPIVGSPSVGGLLVNRRSRRNAVRPAGASPSRLEAIARPEDPGHDGEADGQHQGGRREADADMDVGDAVEAPAEAADEVDDRIEQRHHLPQRRQHLDRVEAAAQK